MGTAAPAERPTRSARHLGEQQRHAARAPAQLAGKPLLSEEEVAAMQARAAQVFERRTSLIEDPADGRLPTLTPQAVERRAARAAAQAPRPRGPADFSLADRCITFGIRVIPLDGRPPVSPKIRHHLGDSRGRFDGDTLVVEATNFHPAGNTMGGYFR